MKYLLAIAVLIVFCLEPAQIAPAQSSLPQVKSSPVEEQKILKAILAEQKQEIKENKDSISALTKAVLSGEIKPKVIYKYRYRTKIKEVHDTIYMPLVTDHMEEDYAIDPTPCPDTITVIQIQPGPIKKKNIFQRIFKHKK
jgi:hypothetical protein